MAIYVVGYDIHPSKGETYTNLTNYLDAYKGNAWHCLDSTWLIKTEKACSVLRNEIWQHMYKDDSLLVVKYHEKSNWAFGGFTGGCADWIKKNL